MTSICVYPEWFKDLLREWGIEYSGMPVDLSAVSCTQVLWSRRSGRTYLFNPDERDAVNSAILLLRDQNAGAAELIEYYFKFGGRSVREVELRYKLSNRAAGEMIAAAIGCVYAVYVGVRKVA